MTPFLITLVLLIPTLSVHAGPFGLEVLKQVKKLIVNDDKSVKCLLFERKNKTWVNMTFDGNVPKDIWQDGKPVKIVIHGFNHDLSPIHKLMKNHYMDILGREYAKYDNTLNVIALDWSTLAAYPPPLYYKAAKNVPEVGKEGARFLINLKKTGAIKDYSLIHILGLSLGSHVAGSMGYHLQNLEGGGKIARITGLDPAGPEFTLPNGKPPPDMTWVLDSGDAEFVDIIHTDMGHGYKWDPVVTGHFGSDLQAGHADFYPNGGQFQRYQCTMFDDRTAACSHLVSVLFYALALREPKEHFGCPCDKWEKFEGGFCNCDYPGTGQLIGDLTSLNSSGRYYLKITKPISTKYFTED